MKTAIICGVCLKPKKESDSYTIRFINGFDEKKKPTYEIKKVCRACTKRMGYKVKNPVKKATLVATK